MDPSGAMETDLEHPDTEFGFSEKSIRLGFVRKVFAILMVQLLITFGIIAIYVLSEDVKTFSIDHPEMIYTSMGITIAVYIVLLCCGNIRRKFPTNIILLGIYTICQGLLLGSVAAYYQADEVLYATAICAIICLGLTLFAFQTKLDFTWTYSLLVVISLNMIIFGIMAAIWQSRILETTYTVLGALLFSLYLVVDIQLIMGNGKYGGISPEEYIFAALLVYLDIINLFLFILRLVGGGK